MRLTFLRGGGQNFKFRYFFFGGGGCGGDIFGDHL